jgi:hypothetical protein
MKPEKLIETRGEEPSFIPAHTGESWQRVEFGLGATMMQSAPGIQESLPPQERHWARMIVYALVGGGLTLLLLFVLSRVFGFPHK